MSTPFFLVQRLTRRDRDIKGFDGLFGCQYMGSAEFEWGAIPESLKRIRASRKIVLHQGTVGRNGIARDVYVVGGKRQVQAVPDLLTEWMKDTWPRGKERTYFPEHVTQTASEYESADAWWALNEDVMWTLREDVSADLLRAVKG